MSTDTTIDFEPSLRRLRAHNPSVPDVRLADVADLLDEVVSSAEPAVVLLSATQLCAQQLCISAVAAVSEAGERAYRIASPREQPGPPRRAAMPNVPATLVAYGGIEVGPFGVVTELSGPATALHCAYEGVLVLTFDHLSPTDAMVGQLVADRAVSLVTVERLHDIAEMHRVAAQHLEIALGSSRIIGVAIGIIMNQFRQPEDRAFDLLCLASQNTNRKVRDLAADVAYTGAFDIPDRALAGPAEGRP